VAERAWSQDPGRIRPVLQVAVAERAWSQDPGRAGPGRRLRGRS